MKHIIPHLWFDTQAVEAANLYAEVFGAKITHTATLHNTPSGDSDIVSFEIDGQPFMAINAGPMFTLNPSISFIVNYDPSRFSDATEKLDAAWAQLSEDGTVRMELGEYPFSKHYGWVEDKYGVNWQLMLTNPEGEPRPFMTPSMLFTGANAGRAEEAIDFYCTVFKEGKRGVTARYPEGSVPDQAGTIMYADFSVMNTWIAAMDSAINHGFTFNEACSFLIPCDTQEELDYYTEKLSTVPESEQCGWVKDQFGVSWQVHPVALDQMLSEGSPEQVARVTAAFLQMKRIDLKELTRVYETS
jgi:predicted 3-demethylubiquinone-9 3-methyltransferase (glyoxalase superfamily)